MMDRRKLPKKKIVLKGIHKRIELTIRICKSTHTSICPFEHNMSNDKNKEAKEETVRYVKYSTQKNEMKRKKEQERKYKSS